MDNLKIQQDFSNIVLRNGKDLVKIEVNQEDVFAATFITKGDAVDIIKHLSAWAGEEFPSELNTKALRLQNVMPRILYFTDENGNNVDVNAAGVNAKLQRDGVFEYFISYGFAGRKELTPVYGA